MAELPVFVSVVLVVHDQASELRRIASEVSEAVGPLVTDYEVAFVDNGSSDDSAAVFRELTSPIGLPNIQAFLLTSEVDPDTAIWAGLEHALGDFVAIADPLVDDISHLPEMLRLASQGVDAVFATNETPADQGPAYAVAYRSFRYLYRRFTGIDIVKDAPSFRLLSRTVVNFILRHPRPAVAYRYLPVSAGFPRAHVTYSTPRTGQRRPSLRQGLARGVRLMFSTTRAPMRIVTTLCLIGAIASVLYSLYVVTIALVRDDVAPGWVSLSLQQSGMFLLISLVLLVLGEYLLTVAPVTQDGTGYHVARELTSATMTRDSRLNVELGQVSIETITDIADAPDSALPVVGAQL